MRETLWNVPSPMPSPIVFVISSIWPLSEYIAKRFGDIVVGIVSERRHLLHLFLSYCPSTHSYNSVLSFSPMSSKRVSLQEALMKRNLLQHRFQVLFAGLLTFIQAPSTPLINWSLCA
ncbi:unnamed protein product [Protopolystoma xenopodis]|uniref:Uncharacterized protein n=1 Tax=Protopolystoma xenopodis TaxID=117903 RepID=A0A3S5BS67_9PLAT|nr:unnamed protein product [Protopolystoma xenopodis]